MHVIFLSLYYNIILLFIFLLFIFIIDNVKRSEIRVFRILLKTAITDSIMSSLTGGITFNYHYNVYVPATQSFQHMVQSFGMSHCALIYIYIDIYLLVIFYLVIINTLLLYMHIYIISQMNLRINLARENYIEISYLDRCVKSMAI